ncbi:hypothetical protein Dacet_2628 [Denitrovibrio acetiphilus DSM 12809]|uniref:PBS lyase HEAT domain protein repeat-containing protein n=1 Tax=Denitrovibrio acetiphilus (strain DSM 12809 / NBRC 114555 / N2460) TaxID=522772 RepID=D4H530_DENA2|nr:HEAT repeat domain-containing protein [Denitrovibrio acetiphilus]ADD69386.1 hypothetical protein Dacet_2628 [Denitrovibrio acetiphilus DSM 12809]
MKTGKPKIKIDISTVDGLRKALTHPEIPVRIATLREIGKSAEKVTAIAEREGEDLLQILTDLCRSAKDPVIRKAFAYAVLSLDDGTRTDFAESEFAESESDDVITLCASKLSGLSEDERLDFFTPFLLNGQSSTKARIAANLLAHSKKLSVELAVRVAVLSDHDVSVPVPDAETLHLWLKELTGVYPFRARNLLLKKEGYFENLLKFWGELPREVCLWSLGVMKDRDVLRHEPLLLNILKNEEDEEVLSRVLGILCSLPAGSIDDSAFAGFLRHSSPEVRASAVGLLSQPVDWQQLLDSEESEKVRIAVIAGIGRLGCKDECGLLGKFFEDQSWRIRAAAVNSLVALAPESVPIVKQYADHDSEDVRAAAAQAFQRIQTTGARL